MNSINITSFIAQTKLKHTRKMHTNRNPDDGVPLVCDLTTACFHWQLAHCSKFVKLE